MGLLDDVLSKAAPGGSLSKPLMIALGTLACQQNDGRRQRGRRLRSPIRHSCPMPAPVVPLPRTAVSLAASAVFLRNSRVPARATPRTPGSDRDRTSRSIPSSSARRLVRTPSARRRSRPASASSNFCRSSRAALPGVVDKLTANGKRPKSAAARQRVSAAERIEEPLRHVISGMDSCSVWLPGFSPARSSTTAEQGMLLDIALGIVGAIAGGFLFSLFGATGVTGFNIYSLIVAVIGSVLVLWLYHMVTGRRAI